ncbi:MAG: tetratricopeptide repeat protein [Rhodospirillaceae bacterium]
MNRHDRRARQARDGRAAPPPRPPAHPAVAAPERPVETIDGLRALVAAEPENDVALYRLGLLLHRSGRPDEGEPLIGRAIALDPGVAERHVNRASALIALGRPADAAAASQRALALAPDLPEAQLNLASALLMQQRAVEAEALVRTVVAARPELPEAWLNLGFARYQQGDAAGAIEAYRAALVRRPDYFLCLRNLGNALLALGRAAEADEAYRAALRLRPDDAETLAGGAAALRTLGRLDEGIAMAERAVAIAPRMGGAHANLASLLHDAGRSPEAVEAFRRAVPLVGNPVEILASLGGVLYRLERLDEAEAVLREALARAPAHPVSNNNLSAIMVRRGAYAEALALADRALAATPAYTEAQANRALALHRLGRSTEALDAYRRSLDANTGNWSTLSNLGVLLHDMGRAVEAIGVLDRARTIAPDRASVHNNLGLAFNALGRGEEAEAAFRAAAACGDASPDVTLNLANILRDRSRWEEAAALYEAAIARGLENGASLMGLAWCRQNVCAWDGVEAMAARALDLAGAEIAAGRFGGIPPFITLNFTDDPARQLAIARNFALTKVAGAVRPAFAHDSAARAARGGRIRLGYVSTDFREHPVGHLIAGMFDRHDRRAFEVFAYSIGANDGSAYRQRIAATVDRFADVAADSAAAIAQRIHADGIDILVDLNGYTGGARVQVFAMRPAPIQINYLGYPATMGAPFMDYIAADRIIAPPEHAAHFAEALVHLPHAYQMNDDRQEIAAEGPDRAACGLPADGFVFCSFNPVYKITPPMFGIWMRLLAAVPGSVLWLLRSNPTVEGNLRREAAARGVDPARLVFADRAPKAVHLARHRNADLFLDTLPVNAHTTASDALWAGLPLLTLPGGSFISRVAASLVTAAGLPELVARDGADYAAIALGLARAPERLAALRARLAATRLQAPLFDTRRQVASLESAYLEMWGRHLAGLPRGPIDAADPGPSR